MDVFRKFIIPHLITINIQDLINILKLDALFNFINESDVYEVID